MPVSSSPAPSAVTARLRTALDTPDCHALAEVLHADVRWSPPDGGSDGCCGRAQVLGRCAHLYARGLAVTVEEAITYPEAIALSLWIRDGEDSAKTAIRTYQVFHLADGLITRIEGHTDRAEALGAAYR
ncbi:nuclear transport factor 2 family protein [Streptomyces violascens]|uniref:SnoaL-like domain-containing protein n=1 Tax=Streptomyces violascens TaxID=67381 RepID=A0ABQ3QXM9_9ACTN|nr:nuclear transport factor 2 family protein [Streptomyces violascens]GGU17909.1 hypothetical protein GCM10010289_44450 [Streptomyces violascens]GHI42037.1 hypothetical protein Sviol_64450 [Streptomyces violascens]